MAPQDPELEALLEALAVSPANVPLRRRAGEVCLRLGENERAEEFLREALRRDPHDVRTMTSLITAFHAQGKNEVALVVFEENLVREKEVPASAWLLGARVALASGRRSDAVGYYRRGVGMDDSLADPAFEQSLGMGGGGGTGPGEQRDAESGSGRRGDNQVLGGRLTAAHDYGDDDAGLDPPERPSINFESVGGMEAVKEEIRMKIIHPLTNKDLYKAYGKTIGGGILMFGPPGCGKTHLARATAGEIRSGFISVGLHDVLDMWIGQSEEKLHQIFQLARRSAPCVLFFDEVDALAASRSDMRHSAGRQVINQFLSELDGVEHSNEGVLVLAATNAPWHLDSAFRRPGRFDRILFVPPPDDPARELILRIHLEGKPLDEIDYAKLARTTAGFSGADLKAVVDQAVEDVLARAMKTGQPIPIGDKELQRAGKARKPSTKEWFATARNHAVYSNEAGIYDDILEYLKLR